MGLNSKEYRIIICGDRNWKDYFVVRSMVFGIREACRLIGGTVTIIEGEAKGADILAREAGEEAGLLVCQVPADWRTHGKAAGPIRNQRMLENEKADLVIAFHDDIENSKGTKDMVNRARKAGKTVYIVSHYDLPDRKGQEVPPMGPSWSQGILHVQ